MNTDPIATWTLIFTILGVVTAAVGIFYAVMTLRAGAESLRLAAIEARDSATLARAQFWVMVRGVFANYDDVHVNLRPGGIWAPRTGETYSPRGPESPGAMARVELYMGMFEYCEALMDRRLLEQEDFRMSYRYRLHNLVRNAVIVREKLYIHKDEWKAFWALCHRLDVRIPTLDEFESSPP